MTAPSVAEERIVEEFRNRVEDILKSKGQHEVSYLLRWLRARDLDLDKAENMLRENVHYKTRRCEQVKAVRWREEHNIDHILEVAPDAYFQNEFPYYINGFDKHSNPVIVVQVGKWDVRKVVSEGKSEEFKLYINYMFESISKEIRVANERRDKSLYPITQFTTIMDWKGFSYMQLCNIKTVQNILYAGRIYEAYYPEYLCRCIFINCPGFFGILLAMIKQLLAQKTYEKISVHGSNREEWEPVCEEAIDANQLSIILKNLS